MSKNFRRKFLLPFSECDAFEFSNRYAGDGETGLLLEFNQSEALEAPPENQPLFLTVSPEAPSGTALSYNYTYSALNPVGFYGVGDHEDLGSNRIIRVSTDVDIGDERYSVVVELLDTDPAAIQSRLPDNVDVIDSVTLAKDVGIVRMSIAGEVFTR